MATLQEILKAKKIEEKTVNEIMEEMKTNKIYTSAEENLDVRYGKLKDEHATKTSELEKANSLIEEMKKANKGNETLQGKITEYEGEVTKLQEELKTTKLASAIKVALLSEKAMDVDYLTFKLKEKGELELDDNDKIKGWDDKLSGLKTQFPTQFEGGSTKKIDEHKLEQGQEKTEFTREEILKKPYAERMKIYSENQEAYNNAMKK